MTENSTVEDRRGGQGPSTTVRRSYLFVIMESDRLLSGGARYSLEGVDEVVIGRGPARSTIRDNKGGSNRLILRLPGPAMSALHARLHCAGSGWFLEDADSTNGSYVNGDRVSKCPLDPDDIIEVGRSFLAVRTYQVAADCPATDLDSQDAHLHAAPRGFATLDPNLAQRLEELQRIADSPIPVLVCGETGTGKELVARGVHALSRRRGPFIAVNCGALTRSLAESQLFGHVRGAFSGAIADSAGFVRAADGGTLLLDEVPDLDPAIQVSLLRVLQESEVVPVGAARPQPVDVRVIAATPAPLPDLVQQGRFRGDLFARLSGFTFVTSSLRGRQVDIGILVAAVLTKMGVTAADELRMSADVVLTMLRHPWPMNIRSLEQVLLRSRVLAKNGRIDMASAHFPQVPADAAYASVPVRPSGSVLGASASDAHAGDSTPNLGRVSPSDLTAAELALMTELQNELAATRGNVAEVARQRGTARMQVYRWLNRFGIDASAFRARDR